MAGFKTHVTGGFAVGFLLGLGVLSSGLVSVWQSIYLIFLGVLGSTLPDLDSDSGRPVKLLFLISSSLIVLMLAVSLISNGKSLLTIVAACCVAYVLCLGSLTVFKYMTKHRGIMHSIPFAIFTATLAALANLKLGRPVSFIAGVAVFAGVMSHLILDELNSFEFRYGIIPHLKKSFGSAIKFTGDNTSITIILYFMTAIALIIYFTVS